MNTGEGQPVDKIQSLFRNSPPDGTDTPNWVQADLDGDGSLEYTLVLPVHEPGTPGYNNGPGAALFVIYWRDDRYVVDLASRMTDELESLLKAPRLFAVADLTGAGHPQIVWTRRFSVNTGPQTMYVFVTSWTPGSFTTLPATMLISSGKVSIEGNNVVLTGGSRAAMFLPTRMDRYRFIDGVFRLVDRRFVNPGEDGYSRLWDGLVAEDSGRMIDAEQAYRVAMDPKRQAHLGIVPRYNARPIQLTDGEVEAFGLALRALARFRLGTLLMATGRQQEAVELVNQATGPYEGLTNSLMHAKTREEGCRVAVRWGATAPNFLTAFNRGVADSPWTADLLCSHPPID